MKRNLSPNIAVIALFAALTISSQSFAQQPHYELVDLGTFGGTQSYVNYGSGLFFGQHIAEVNREGAVVGFADTSAPDPFYPNFCFGDCSVAHTFLSDASGKLTNLGALPGGGSSAPSWITANGFVAGVSENGETDPLYSGLPQMLAVVWFDNHIFDLKTLEGGYQSEANAVNSLGQVVGAALNTIPDDNSMQGPNPVTGGGGTFWLWGGISPAYAYQTRAFIWDADNGMQDLGTLGGTDAQALLINDRGQVVGHSYINSTPSPLCAYPLATRSFIWEKQTGMVDLGNFGGTCTLATDLNEGGQVVGSSNLTGDGASEAFLWDGKLHHLGGSLGGSYTGASAVNEAGEAVGFGYLAGNASFHATLWKHIVQITDLGVIGNDQCSYAADINAQGQVVGSSMPTCDGDPTSFRAFLWQDGSLFDLNTLIPPNSPLYLQYVMTINDSGEIAGQGVDGTGNEHAFLLIPCDEDDWSQSQQELEGAAQQTIPAPAMQGPRVGPRNLVPQMIRPQLGSRPHIFSSAGASSGPEGTAATEAATPLTITSGDPPGGRVGSVYDVRCNQIPPCNLILAGFPVRAAGGLQPYSWSMTAQPGSSLPPGLSFPVSHLCRFVGPPAICGKPTEAGNYDVVVTVTDSEKPPRHASARYTIPIAAAAAVEQLSPGVAVSKEAP